MQENQLHAHQISDQDRSMRKTTTHTHIRDDRE